MILLTTFSIVFYNSFHFFTFWSFLFHEAHCFGFFLLVLITLSIWVLWMPHWSRLPTFFGCYAAMCFFLYLSKVFEFVIWKRRVDIICNYSLICSSMLVKYDNWRMLTYGVFVYSFWWWIVWSWFDWIIFRKSILMSLQLPNSRLT